MMINKNERVLPDMSSAPGAAGAAGAAAAAVASPPVDSGRSKKVQPFPSQRKGKEGVTVNLRLHAGDAKQNHQSERKGENIHVHLLYM